jgi:uncharacterized protein (TIRG00374 family)
MCSQAAFGHREMKFTFLRIILVVALLALLFQIVDFEMVFREIGKIRPWAWLAISTIFLGNVAFGALRLSCLAEIVFRDAFLLVFGSLYYQNFLPAQMGADGYKIAMLKHKHEMRTTRALSVVVTDRYFGLTGLVFLCGLSLLSVLIPGLTHQSWAPGFNTGWILAAGLVFLLLSTVLMNLHRMGLGGILERWKSTRPGARLLDVRDGVISMLPSRRRVTVYALMQHVSIGLIVFTVVMSMGLDAGFLHIVAATALLLLGVMLFPFTLNGVGIREFLAIALYSTLGFSSEQAVAISLTPYLVFVVFSLAGGAVSLLSSGKARRNDEP